MQEYAMVKKREKQLCNLGFADLLICYVLQLNLQTT